MTTADVLKNIEQSKSDLAVVVAYIMYYDMLEDKINGSFFSKIDKAMEIGQKFNKKYPESFEWGVEIDFEETLNEYVKNEK